MIHTEVRYPPGAITGSVRRKASRDVRSGDDGERWTVVIPFHNERTFLPLVLRSIATQHERLKLILVDNASTDRSSELARQLCDDLGLSATHVREAQPGKVAALQRGLEEVATEFVATCDADTFYPADYLTVGQRLLSTPGAVAAIAANCDLGAAGWAARMAGLRLSLTARLLQQQCLNGGASQVFRTSALQRCGGFDPAIWNWVLEDHEVMARIALHGQIAYGRDFLCHPSQRPRSVNCTGWTLIEQVRYHATAPSERVAYFHEFLAPRLRARALSSERLRRQDTASLERDVRCLHG